MTIAGTDDYMAPEVILGMPYAYPADIFSFGITLAEVWTADSHCAALLTYPQLILRQKPFPRHPRAAFEFEVAEFTAAVPPDCPPEFSALVIACCAYEPTQRPDAKTILRGLRELLTVVQKREAAAAAPAEPRAPSPRPTPVPVTPLASSTEHEQPVSSALPRTRAASLPTVAAAVVAAPVVASGPYQGRSPSPLDMAPSGLPREKVLIAEARVRVCACLVCLICGLQSFTRSLCAFCATPMDSKPLPDVRRRWVPLSAVPASAPQATLELEYGTKKRSHIKALFVLWGDVLFYWPKGSKRIDYNIGRILVDRSLRVQLLEVGKKKTQLRLVGWNGEEFSLLAKPPVLQQWHDAIVKAQGGKISLCVPSHPLILSISRVATGSSSCVRCHSDRCQGPHSALARRCAGMAGSVEAERVGRFAARLHARGAARRRCCLRDACSAAGDDVRVRVGCAVVCAVPGRGTGRVPLQRCGQMEHPAQRCVRARGGQLRGRLRQDAQNHGS